MLMTLVFVIGAMECVRHALENISVLLAILDLCIVAIVIVHVLQEHLLHKLQANVNHANHLVFNAHQILCIAKNVRTVNLHIEDHAHPNALLVHILLDKYV